MPKTRSQGQAEKTEEEPEIETTARKNRRKNQPVCEMEIPNPNQRELQPQQRQAEQNVPPAPIPNRRRLFGDDFEADFGNYHNVRGIEVDSYQIPPAVIGLIQQGVSFQGLENEDPNAHLRAYLTLCNTFKLQGVTQDETRRVLFPFSLRGKARMWYDAADGQSFADFEETKRRFIAKYFPASKIDELRNTIYQFRQFEDENFRTTWERFQELVKKGPRGMIDENQELIIFYKGLTTETQNLVLASSGGAIMELEHEQVKELFQKIAKNCNVAKSERTIPQKAPTQVLELNVNDKLQATVDMLVQKFNKLEAKNEGRTTGICGLCQGDHHMDLCPTLAQPVNFMQPNRRPTFGESYQRPQGNQNWNQGNQQWRPQQGWNNSGNQVQQQQQPWNNQGPRRPLDPESAGGQGSLETMMKQMMTDLQEQNKKNDARDLKIDRRLDDQDKRIHGIESSMRSMETMWGQFAQNAQSRPQGFLPSNTIQNPNSNKEGIENKSSQRQ